MQEQPDPLEKPRLRGVSHAWAFVLSLFSGAALVALARDTDAALVALVYALSGVYSSEEAKDASEAELEAIEDPAERKRVFEERVARMYEFGKATSVATALEIDGVIDPAETRHWLCRGLATWQPPRRREGKKRPFVDTW